MSGFGPAPIHGMLTFEYSGLRCLALVYISFLFPYDIMSFRNSVYYSDLYRSKSVFFFSRTAPAGRILYIVCIHLFFRSPAFGTQSDNNIINIMLHFTTSFERDAIKTRGR